jgi:hypothetical protein
MPALYSICEITVDDRGQIIDEQWLQEPIYDKKEGERVINRLQAGFDHSGFNDEVGYFWGRSDGGRSVRWKIGTAPINANARYARVGAW